ncbi:unnamed protein product [Chondrus crispus]|uniref:Uncharacterized protein n=1 Tax=Chondrus crispus TaxID=2769 RepID=R7Q4F3_CHOCR|nr:unnamed protein product [Chondrus crispus]CDF32345.1 unnamed protein product [Chondrus crispus]|eukprot:XP_005712010.1 unnamed protein product [Chondrus crispus]
MLYCIECVSARWIKRPVLESVIERSDIYQCEYGASQAFSQHAPEQHAVLHARLRRICLSVKSSPRFASKVFNACQLTFVASFDSRAMRLSKSR